MRGKVLYFTLLYFLEGITPAYAGKSLGSISIRSHIRDHPRLCGEKLTVLVYPLHVQGSPPPMRGKGTATAGRGTGTGITPAYAGKSKVQDRFVFIFQDHPRLCGEKYKM